MVQEFTIFVRNLHELTKQISTTSDLPTAINRVELYLRNGQYAKSTFTIRWCPGVRINNVLVFSSLVYKLDEMGNTIIRTG